MINWLIKRINDRLDWIIYYWTPTVSKPREEFHREIVEYEGKRRKVIGWMNNKGVIKWKTDKFYLIDEEKNES